jgi:hypothetical protein
LHTAVTRPRKPSKTLNNTTTRPSAASPPIRPSRNSPSLIHHGPKCHLLATQNRASRRSLQNQTVGINAWVRTTEYLPNQQTPGTSTVTFANGAFQNSTSSQIQTDMPKEDLRHGAREIRGPPPLFMPIEQPPRDPPETCNPPLQTLPVTQRQGQQGKETTVQGQSSTGTGPMRSKD